MGPDPLERPAQDLVRSQDLFEFRKGYFQGCDVAVGYVVEDEPAAPQGPPQSEAAAFEVS